MSHLTKCDKSGKISHREYYTAAMHMKRLSRRCGERLGDLDVYVCPDCSHYHVGHRPGTKKIQPSEVAQPCEEGVLS